MINTTEYYGGLYPDPPQEVIDEEPDEWDITDEYYELKMLGEIE
jgi:hypothetical protein